MTTILIDRCHPMRDRLERSIRAVFLAEYGAHVPELPMSLLACLDADGAPAAATGLRFTVDGLFSEAYLDGPVETVLAAALDRAVARDRIVEFSNLAALRPGAALPLIAVAIRHCLAVGAEFGLFTATARLRALLRRAGLGSIDLGPARRERMAGAAAWGSYYRHDPHVLAVAADALPQRLLATLDAGGLAHA